MFPEETQFSLKVLRGADCAASFTVSGARHGACVLAAVSLAMLTETPYVSLAWTRSPY